jgi:hypothetical protein
MLRQTGLLLSVNKVRSIGKFGQFLQGVALILDASLQGDEAGRLPLPARQMRGQGDIVEHLHAAHLQLQLLESKISQFGVILAREFLRFGEVTLVLTGVLGTHGR